MLRLFGYNNLSKKFLNEFRKFIPFKLKTIIYFSFSLVKYSLLILFAAFHIYFFGVFTDEWELMHTVCTNLSLVWQCNFTLIYSPQIHVTLLHAFGYAYETKPNKAVATKYIFLVIHSNIFYFVLTQKMLQQNLPPMHLMWLSASKYLHFMYPLLK